MAPVRPELFLRSSHANLVWKVGSKSISYRISKEQKANAVSLLYLALFSYIASTNVRFTPRWAELSLLQACVPSRSTLLATLSDHTLAQDSILRYGFTKKQDRLGTSAALHKALISTSVLNKLQSIEYTNYHNSINMSNLFSEK